MMQPHRAERFCLVMTVATLWLVSMAGQVNTTLPACSLDALPPTHVARQHAEGRSQRRELSCVTVGLLWLLHTLVAGAPLPSGALEPDPWPEPFPLPRKHLDPSARNLKPKSAAGSSRGIFVHPDKR